MLTAHTSQLTHTQKCAPCRDGWAGQAGGRAGGRASRQASEQAGHAPASASARLVSAMTWVSPSAMRTARSPASLSSSSDVLTPAARRGRQGKNVRERVVVASAVKEAGGRHPDSRENATRQAGRQASGQAGRHTRTPHPPTQHPPKCAATASATVSARMNRVFQAERLPAPALSCASLASL